MRGPKHVRARRAACARINRGVRAIMARPVWVTLGCIRGSVFRASEGYFPLFMCALEGIDARLDDNGHVCVERRHAQRPVLSRCQGEAIRFLGRGPSVR